MSYSYIYKDNKSSATKNDATNDNTKSKFASKKVTKNTDDSFVVAGSIDEISSEDVESVSSNGIVGLVPSSKSDQYIRQDTSISACITLNQRYNPNSNKSVHNPASAASIWFQKKRDKNKTIAANLLKEANFNNANESYNSDNSIDSRYNEAGVHTELYGEKTNAPSNTSTYKFPPASIGSKIVRQCELCKMLYTSFHTCDSPGDTSSQLTNKPVFASK